MIHGALTPNPSPKVFSLLTAISAVVLTAVFAHLDQWFMTAIWSLIVFFASAAALGGKQFRTYCGATHWHVFMQLLYAFGSVGSGVLCFIGIQAHLPTDSLIMAGAFAVYCATGSMDHGWLRLNN